ncbi:Heparan-alpha-glucosaminide N-acetyltransferase, catalytic domain [Dillenia turbinata]|uniref:Heparan-alpha-glucosaminide N-acetyltransferase, catalytic domain n=1 Tax=Dillenia turbinata TaxID=194707 RepID=A0AAN8VWE8_9MAGN
MSSMIVFEEERVPLLENSASPIPHEDEEISLYNEPNTSCPDSSTQNQTQRLVSLDVFRGLTIALMILVDDAGGAFPSINHSPWFGITIADFVVPFFLFSVGISISLVFKKISSRSKATKKVILRTVKLFVLGVALQGGYFHGRGNLTYGVDLGKIRWLGILQRISVGYCLASLSEIWLVEDIVVDSTLTFLRKYYIQGMVAMLLFISYMCLLYGLFVPNWEFEIPGINTTLSSSSYASSNQIVYCGVRGSLEPPCNAAGLIDRFFVGQHHLYQHPVYRRMEECSINSPDYGPLPPNSPGWCLAPFDPEGILRFTFGICADALSAFDSSFMAAITCFLGLHFGHIIVHYKDYRQRVIMWSISFFPVLILGYVLNVLGIPFCKPLFTLSYMCITAGASGFLLTIIFYIVDVKHLRKPTMLLQWMGMNALLIYALAACELLPVALQGFYWRSPEYNLDFLGIHCSTLQLGVHDESLDLANLILVEAVTLLLGTVDGTESLLQAMLRSKRWGTLAFVMVEILFWGLVAGYLHVKRTYIKL